MAGIRFYCSRRASALLPVDEASESEMARIPAGRVVEVTVYQRRSAAADRFFWALCDCLARALRDMGRDDTKDSVADQLKIVTGHCRVMSLGPAARRETGERFAATPTSIRWDKMDGIQFKAFLDRVIVFVSTELLPHIPLSETRERIDGLLDDDVRRRYVLERGNRRHDHE